MNRKVRWGVLGAAKIAVAKVIPAMQLGEWSEVTALASRNLKKARAAADSLQIPKVYGSYEELLADSEIEAIYNPLPNHLHVTWTIRSVEAGKHVLCEKPIGLNVDDARRLLEARDRTGMKIQEAFMVRTHPQWLATRDLVRSGRIGELRTMTGIVSFFNRDPENVRNKIEMGGGALLDIGCYPINLSRFVFDAEPLRALALIDRDPEMKVDRLTSALLEFPKGQATFTCSIQLAPYQRMQFVGTRGRIEIEVPLNAPVDRPARIFVDDGSDLQGRGEVIEFPTCNQYTIQGDLFSIAIREQREQPIPLEDALANMAVIDAVFRSAESGTWEAV